MASSSFALTRASFCSPLPFSPSPSPTPFSSSSSSSLFLAGAIAPFHSGKRLLCTTRVRPFPFNTSVDKSKNSLLVLKAFAEDEGKAAAPPLSKKKAKLVVKPQKSPRLVLRFLWLEKNIGIGLDQVVPGHGTVPLSPFYFWPRKDAWEELKVKLESKPWISRKRTIILLNQATDIINLWQQSATIY